MFRLPQIFRGLALAALLQVPGVSLAQTPASAPCRAPDVGGYFPHQFQDRRAVLVFVHGVMGDPVKTWLNSPVWGADVFLPCLVHGEVKTFGAANTYLYGFVSGALSASPSIDEAARRLFSDLEAAGVFRDHAHVGFVAHSLGGLVVSRMILLHMQQPALQRVRFTHFYGTPAQGSEAAAIGEFLSGNIQFSEIRDGSSLQALISRWRSTSRQLGIASHCVAEMKKMSWLPWKQPVVPQESAWALCETEANRTRAYLDHSEIVTPRTPQDEPLRALRSSYMKCVAPGLRHGTPRSLATQPEGQSVIEWLNRLRLNLDLGAPGMQDPVYQVKLALGKAADGSWRRYAAPTAGQISFAPTDYSQLDVNQFSNEFRTQMERRLKHANVESVLRLPEFAPYTADGLAHELQEALLAGGTVTPADMALVLRVQAPGPAGRIVLFVQDSAAALNGRDARLLGFALMADPRTCL